MAIVSAVVIIVALGFANWSGSPVRPDFNGLILFVAIFFVVAIGSFAMPALKGHPQKIIILHTNQAKARATRAMPSRIGLLLSVILCEGFRGVLLLSKEACGALFFY